MAKTTSLIALLVAVVVCAEAIRIDPVQPPSRDGRVIMTENDPRCKKGNGLFPNPEDCTRYVRCINGSSEDRKCPAGFKFDARRYCIHAGDNPDCGKRMSSPMDARCKNGNGLFPNPEDCNRYIKCINGKGLDRKCPPGFKFDTRRYCVPASDRPDCGERRMSSSTDADVKCPKSYGIFPIESDCHKFMVCVDGIPTVKQCPKKQIYRDINGGCVDGDKCPKQIEEPSVCKKANELVADENNCRRYIKCVNFQPIKKECPPGRAFNPEKRTCTKEQLDKCKKNDISHIGQDE